MDKEDRAPRTSEELFHELFTTQRKRIQRLCWTYANNDEDRRDLYQEVLLRIWRGLQSFRNTSALSTWAYRIAVNTGIDHVRKMARQKGRRTTRYVEEMDIADDRASIEPLAIEWERQRTLRACLERLSLMDRTIITLWSEDVPYADIADVLGISSSNVGVKVHRIKHALSAMLEGWES
jgi:RNA polymerase sigma-70 factor (ECF subfamily)